MFISPPFFSFKSSCRTGGLSVFISGTRWDLNWCASMYIFTTLLPCSHLFVHWFRDGSDCISSVPDNTLYILCLCSPFILLVAVSGSCGVKSIPDDVINIYVNNPPPPTVSKTVVSNVQITISLLYIPRKTPHLYLSELPQTKDFIFETISFVCVAAIFQGKYAIIIFSQLHPSHKCWLPLVFSGAYFLW